MTVTRDGIPKGNPKMGIAGKVSKASKAGGVSSSQDWPKRLLVILPNGKKRWTWIDQGGLEIQR